MYTGKNAFVEKINPEILDTPLNFRATTAGVFTYEGKYEGVRILVETSMNSTQCMNYFHTETVSELLESDNFKISFNEVCALWVS